MREIVVLAANELLGLGLGELWCCAMQRREVLISNFEVVIMRCAGMCWDVLKRTGGVGSFVMQEEVVRVADELFEKE